MIQALRPTSRSKILEIGTGSGYQTAILSQLGRRIYSVERYQKLAATAKSLIEELSIANVTILCDDGSAGLPEQAPFDRIIVSAAVDDVPRILLSQLKPNGILVAPVGRSDTIQTIVRVVKTENTYHYTDLKQVRFLPIEEGKETFKVNNFHNT
jgi:protein-L-isoaspartate(D-aspartate) O-methyltransferase